jgi:cephalosporin hydroxylase
VDQVMQRLPADRKNAFLILDSDHSARHVKRELDAWIPRLRTGDYLVVEDTVVNGNPVRPDHGPGPLEAVREYVDENPQALVRDTAREAKFGATFAPEGYYRIA